MCQYGGVVGVLTILMPLFIPGVSLGLAAAFFFRQLAIAPSLWTITGVHVLWALPFAFLVILAVPGPAMGVLASFLGMEPQKVAPALVLYFINIHHYFTDGVAWKISNPEVRRELFAHVAAPAPLRRSPRPDREAE